ncbi:MAG TPA: sigma-70 family RNA polymerase sigma factor [Gaiellaceae bacterium]|jgi:RNA polymerase sigma factor (sigma-70 family)|nr:sigma-70 family RNA polymerase sigma factor [Gaiellaceae bacterium]
MTPLLAQRPRVDRGFERLYRRHVADVYHYALGVLRNPADAEDVTQTTFLNALRAYDRGERPQAPQNWLIAIAHNVCRQRFRQSLRRPHEVAFEDDVADRIVDDEVPSAEDIRRALGYLAFNQRAALVMRELEGRTYAEIAEILGLSIGAVETLLFRARRALREQLEESLTCHEAEHALSKQLDGRLERSGRGPLRAHLRACADCATVARRQRAQRTAFKSLAAVPLPTSLASLFGGGGGAAVGTGVAAKAAAVVATAALAGGVGYEGAHHAGLVHRSPAPKARHVGGRPASLLPDAVPTLRQNRLVRVRAEQARTREAAVSHGRHAAAKASVRAHAAPRAHPAHPAHPGRPIHPVRPRHPTHPIQAVPTHPAHPVHPAHPTHAAHQAHPKHARGHKPPKE